MLLIELIGQNKFEVLRQSALGLDPVRLVGGSLFFQYVQIELDILELLTRCPVNLVQLRTLADGYLMRRDLDAVLGRVGL